MTKAANLITKGQYKRAFKLLISQSLKAAEAFRGLAAQEVSLIYIQWLSDNDLINQMIGAQYNNHVLEC